MATPRRRNSESISPRIGTRLYSSNKRQKIDNGTVQENDLTESLGDDDSLSIVAELFRHVPPGIWWRLIPEKNSTDDISYATSVDWEDIYSLFVFVKIIAKRHVRGVERLFVSNGALDKVVSKLEPAMRLQICRYRINQASSETLRSYHFCIGVAKYRLKDLARAKEDGLSLESAAINESLRSKCSNAARDIRERASQQASEQEKEQPSAQASEPASEQENPPLQADTAVAEEQQQQEEYVDTENDIKCALQLNFKSDPRYVRGSNAKVITLHSRKQFTPEERALTILLANGWGYQDITKNCDERGRIGKAACQQMSFDCGYKKPIQGTQLHVWLKHLQDAFISGEPKRGLELRLKGSQKVLDRLEQAHSGYVRELFLYAKQKCGRKPTFAKLATVMIARSADPQEERPTIVKLQRKQVGDWYKANKDAETELVTNDPSNFSEEAEAYNSHDEFDL